MDLLHMIGCLLQTPPLPHAQAYSWIDEPRVTRTSWQLCETRSSGSPVSGLLKPDMSKGL